METFLRDVRLGVRLLWRQPSFTVAAVAVLALGIGANTAMFSLVNAFLLKPLLIERPEEIVGAFDRDAKKPESYRAFSYAAYVDLREKGSVFSRLAAHNMAMVGLSEGAASANGADAAGTTRRVFADVVSANYFDTFGVPLFRGRAFSKEEERPGSAVPVVIVSHRFWKRHGADPNLLGKILRINGKSFTVVGIAANGFTGTTALISSELYLPLGMYESLENDFGGRGRPLSAPDNYVLLLVGRMQPGLSIDDAESQLLAISKTLERTGAETEERTMVVRPLSRLSVSTSPTTDDQLRLPSLLLLSMSSIVLLIASLNVANMMLARGSARRKEISIRLALGAGRRSILLQLSTESLLLATLGGAVGLVVAFWSTQVLVRSLAGLAPIDLVYNAAPDLRVLAATLAFCVLSTLFFGLGPALNLSRPDVFSDLKGREQEGGGGQRQGWRGWISRRQLLVVGQLSLSLVLLTAAGLFLRSSAQAARLEPGFGVDNGLVVEVDPSLVGYDDTHGAALYRTLVPRLRAIPGVEAVSVAATVPFGMVSLGRGIQRASDPPPTSAAEGSQPPTTADVIVSSFNIVGPDYFQAMDIRVLRGRPFEDRESESSPDATASRVVVVNQVLADKLWPKGDALGQRVRLIVSEAQHEMHEAEIVGVVASVQEHVVGSDGVPGPQLYVPFGQEYQSNMSLHLRTAVQGQAAEVRILAAVRREIRAVDSQLPVLSLKTLRQHLEASFDFWLARTAARMFMIFGGVALVIAVIGLYGVRAYAVARRTREIGIRMAVGASRQDALGLILREGLRLTATGIVIGLVLSLALGWVLSRMLYQVSAVDPVVFAAAALLLAGVSLVACYVPARRAARIEPMVALRDE